ncbi:MAG: hypothetical protein Lokiarch_33640 [Candidatus Lokiarchaeum sp. GC14_75]|nr:MAG: hypothetical protein Lokiarch_33640 [Candidatus Lokiarchaeum sp. GC14_75]
MLNTISVLEIPTNKVQYNKKTKVFSVEIMDFMFVGNYKKSIRVSIILDDMFASLGENQLDRSDIYFLDPTTDTKIHGNTKLKNLFKVKEKKAEKQKTTDMKPSRRSKVGTIKRDDGEALFEEELAEFEELDEDMAKDYSAKEEMVRKVDEKEVEESRNGRAKKKIKSTTSSSSSNAPGGALGGDVPSSPALPPSPPPALAGPRPPPPKVRAPAPATLDSEILTPGEPEPIVYDINMGLQYYSIMMEQRSYLFYVYFSHKELKIVDEEGKIIYKTTIKIVTTKKEPPVLDLRIEGEGFEVHPLYGKVEVKKDAVNPPVMIFSVLPVKSAKKKKKKEFERRYLNAYVDFEGETISHTILSIMVQPKYFRLDIGPIHLNLSKKTAVIVSFISILIAGISLLITILSLNPTSNFMDYLGSFAPGLGSIIFFAIFLITLFKEGLYPMKEKISAFLNFDQAGVLIK